MTVPDFMTSFAVVMKPMPWSLNGFVFLRVCFFAGNQKEPAKNAKNYVFAVNGQTVFQVSKMQSCNWRGGP